MDKMKKIIIIDDVPEYRELFSNLLEGDYQVLEARDAREGLEMIEKELPDLVFLDVSLPGMSGLELIEILRQHPTLYHIPVVAVTAHSVFSAKKAMEKGCNDFLLKPLAPRRILEMIKKWIETV